MSRDVSSPLVSTMNLRALDVFRKLRQEEVIHITEKAVQDHLCPSYKCKPIIKKQNFNYPDEYRPEQEVPFNEKVKSMMSEPGAVEWLNEFISRALDFAKQPDYAERVASFFTEKVPWQPPASEEYYQRLKKMKENTGAELHFMDNVIEQTG